jgi:hypothetical protein
LTPEALANLSVAAFDHVVPVTTGFRSRSGQREMAQCIAGTLSGVTLEI